MGERERGSWKRRELEKEERRKRGREERREGKEGGKEEKKVERSSKGTERGSKEKQNKGKRANRKILCKIDCSAFAITFSPTLVIRDSSFSSADSVALDHGSK